APARRHGVFAQAQSFSLHRVEQRARDDSAHGALAPGRAHSAAERDELGELRGALVAAEEMLLERRFLFARQVTEPVVDQGGELGAHAASMQARSLPSARWRITRTLPALKPNSQIDFSSKKLPMTTDRSRSESASRQAASRSRSKTRGSGSSIASSTITHSSKIPSRRA